LTDISRAQVRVKIIGERARFSPVLQTLMTELETVSASYADTTISVALSYGGRAEIVAACNQAVALGVAVDEKKLSELMWTAGTPDPDMIIRTGGDMRLSNFLPWQSIYSELFFTDTYWPAFTKDEFTRIVGRYADRQRRRGK
jgi:undecaprenyl diphosphate synthase